MMAPDVCEVCGAADPRWVRIVDRTIADYTYRTMLGYPGPTSHGARYCDTPECAAVIEERYGPPGNDAALARVTGALKLDIEFRTL